MIRRQRLKEIEGALDTANSKPDNEFVRDYLVKYASALNCPSLVFLVLGGFRPDIVHSTAENAPTCWASTWTHPRTATAYDMSLSQVAETSDADLEACFSLVEETSQRDYAASSQGWKPRSKRKEMREPDLRYILVKDPDARVCGYTSFMPTLEEGEAVIYCYEIHLKPDLRSTGLAGLMMSFLETIASNISVVHKVMLTVFTSNTRALSFYQRCGFEVDDISPKPRKLRNGVVKEPDYAIMSKCV